MATVFKVGTWSGMGGYYDEHWPIGFSCDEESTEYNPGGSPVADWKTKSVWCYSPLGHIGETCVFCGYIQRE